MRVVREPRTWQVTLIMVVVTIGACTTVQAIQVLPVDTDPTVHRKEGCEAMAIGDPVNGRLAIAVAADGAQAILRTSDGQLLHIVWPGGFAVQTSRPPALLDDRGTVLFREGEEVELSQVSTADHDGSEADPYTVTGLVLGVCWGRTGLG